MSSTEEREKQKLLKSNSKLEPEINKSEALVYYAEPVGPDQLCAASSMYSSDLNVPVSLRSNLNDRTKYLPISIYTMFKKTVDLRPDQKALAYQVAGTWCFYSYKDYWRLCIKSAKSFIKLGLKSSECVTIIGFNCPQWFISCLGSILSGYKVYFKLK